MVTAVPTLRTGWEADAPVGDTLVRGALVAHAARVTRQAEAAGRPWSLTDQVAMADMGSAEPFASFAVSLAPVVTGALVESVCEFISGGFVLVSATPTPDLRAHGLT